MSAPKIPEFAVLAAAHELNARIPDTAGVDLAEVAEAVLLAALPLMASPTMRLHAREALLSTFAQAMRDRPVPDMVELAEDAYQVVERYLRGASEPDTYEVVWHRKSWQDTPHVEFIEAHYMAYEDGKVRFRRETDDAGYVMVLEADRPDIRTVRRVPADGEPVPYLGDGEVRS